MTENAYKLIETQKRIYAKAYKYNKNTTLKFRGY